MSLRIKSVGVLAFVALCSTAQADLLPLILQPSPDISSGFINTSYSAATDQFTAVGWTSAYFDGTTLNSMSVVGMFTLTATIDEFGVATAGTLTLEGEVSGFGPSLLTADLLLSGANFGWSADGLTFEFMFDVTGGEMAAIFGDIVGVILSPSSSGFAGFGSDFSHSGFGGVADVAPPIPAPATIVLLIGAACGIQRRRRR